MALPPRPVNGPAVAHRIGPNAITRVEEALREEVPAAELGRLFGLASLGAYLDAAPREMVDEREVTRLHRVLRQELGLPRALGVAREAGLRTGDYLLAHRIPKGVQALLRLLPASLASRVLLRAIQRHAWTFSGSGTLRLRMEFPPRLAIAGCCICRDATAESPLCDYYAAAIERLYRVLVHRRARVLEITCQATGAEACTFEIRW